MTRTARITAFILAAILLAGWAYCAEDEDRLTEEEYSFIYNEERYQRHYLTNRVAVALKMSVTETTGYEALFPELEIQRVERYDPEGYEQGRYKHQMIYIYMESQGREGIISIIELLKSNPYVYYSEPYYIIDGTGVGASAPFGPGYSDGDLTLDGTVDNADLVCLARYLVGLRELTITQLRTADMNRDGSVTNQDVILLALLLVKR